MGSDPGHWRKKTFFSAFAIQLLQGGQRDVQTASYELVSKTEVTEAKQKGPWMEERKP